MMSSVRQSPKFCRQTTNIIILVLGKKALWLVLVSLNQGSPNYGPRAAYGPPPHLTRPPEQYRDGKKANGYGKMVVSYK